MSPVVFYSLLVPAALAVMTVVLTFYLRNELPNGSARPLPERMAFSGIAGVIVLGLTLFAAFLPTWFAVYFITWWTTLFAVLPFGIRSQQEAGAVVTGSEPGAPETPAMRRKLIVTTAISLPLFAILILAVRLLPIL